MHYFLYFLAYFVISLIAFISKEGGRVFKYVIYLTAWAGKKNEKLKYLVVLKTCINSALLNKSRVSFHSATGIFQIMKNN